MAWALNSSVENKSGAHMSAAFFSRHSIHIETTVLVKLDPS